MRFVFQFSEYKQVIFFPKLAISFGNSCIIGDGSDCKAYGLDIGLFNFDLFIGIIAPTKTRDN